MKNILILAANPKGTNSLRLDREVREIDHVLRASHLRDRFKLHQRWAVRTRDLQRALLEIQPEIVHFCGHGEGTAGIALEDVSGQSKLVATAPLSTLFGLCSDHVSCVLMNACHSEIQSDAIVESIDYVIGMRRAVPDVVAIAFSTGFYQALGAGQSIEASFENGRDAIRKNTGEKGPNRDINVVGAPNRDTSLMSMDDIPVLKKKREK